MTKSFRASFFLMIALLLAPAVRAVGEGVRWVGSLDDALKRGREEKKVVIAWVRSGCGPCMVKPDKQMAEAETHAPIVYLYGSFVLARVDKPDHPKLKDIKLPALLALDSTGEIVVKFDALGADNALATFLSDMRVLTPSIVRGAEQRASGQDAEADIILGDAQLRIGFYNEAMIRFRRAESQFEKAGNAERAQFAHMYVLFTQYLMMRKDRSSSSRALVDLMRAVNHPLSKANEADGWVAIAVIRFLERDRGGSAKAYRRALELADPASETAALARSALTSLGVTVIENETPTPTSAAATIRVVPPPRSSITGRAEFVALTTPQVVRVAFFLDGKFAAAAQKQPFRARIDVGSPPRLRTIKAIAYDRSNNPVAEASTNINDNVDVFRVSIVSPVAEALSGRATIEADAQVPEGRRLQGLELFWNDVKVATLEKPPFRHQLEVPEGFGYLRAVATLDDGTSAEDTRTYNSSGFVANVDVSAVTFAAMVVDRQGHRVDRLGTRDFVVKDEGKPIDVTARDNPEEPVTIGLAIDASASMRAMLLDVYETGQQFLHIAVNPPREKAFVVAFDEIPHVVHRASDDVQSLEKAIWDIRPAGGTSLYDAVAFSLQQFSGIGGKKALVVLTDAREGASAQTAEVCLRMARATGIPIYVVVPQYGNMSRFGSGLENITNATGGLVFYGPQREELSAIFTRIRDEVRGQYLLSFVAPEAKSGLWRRISVEVPSREAKVRTIDGYFTR